MQAWIEGQRNEGVAQRVEEEAAAFQDAELDAQLGKERVLIDLLNEEDPEQFMAHYMRNLHVRCGLDWNEYKAAPPRSCAQRVMAKVREGLFRLLRPALEWLTFRQSVVNNRLTSLLMDEHKSRLETEARLRAEMHAIRNTLILHDEENR